MMYGQMRTISLEGDQHWRCNSTESDHAGEMSGCRECGIQFCAAHSSSHSHERRSSRASDPAVPPPSRVERGEGGRGTTAARGRGRSRPARGTGRGGRGRGGRGRDLDGWTGEEIEGEEQCQAEEGQHGEGARVACSLCQVTLCPTHLANHTCCAASQPAPSPGPGRGRGGGRGSGDRGPGGRGRGRSQQGPVGSRSPPPATQSSSGDNGAAAAEAGVSQPGGTVEASLGEATIWLDKEADSGLEAADGPVVPQESLDSAIDADPPPEFAPMSRERIGGGVTTSDGVSTEGEVSTSNFTNNLGAASPLPPASPQALSITITKRSTEYGPPEGVGREETTGDGLSTEGGRSHLQLYQQPWSGMPTPSCISAGIFQTGHRGRRACDPSISPPGGRRGRSVVPKAHREPRE